MTDDKTNEVNKAANTETNVALLFTSSTPASSMPKVEMKIGGSWVFSPLHIC